MPGEYASTPRLTVHARERCVEMGVSTKRVKLIAARPDMVTAAREGRCMAWRRDDPEIAVYFEETPQLRLVVTVVPRTYDRYERGAPPPASR